ncbi:hypothetical protein FA09DRAFT_300059 [Tilletiopsis washingtonensis]|uniref:Uncharacterized protein n=1 Tax=Tilletiopsis washingtonensis TaxID=58919 RepID=A0A316Z6B0_9BASI|nr:hypothetical protein FA09DRAFT_300059 [Tilletiopsis washingtonensis]PWN96498.1 hypothetical protein FA09DRAFT_300059 [Tilletiopsis washingtonensis]
MLPTLRRLSVRVPSRAAALRSRTLVATTTTPARGAAQPAALARPSSVRLLHSDVSAPSSASPTSIARPPLPAKILIANRGEISCRIMRTCRRLGIRTVAVYSEADARSMHVQLADEAYCIGPAASAESYLRSDRVIDVALKTGATMVHPGYGFLSENAEFSAALHAAGLTFIGPPASAITSMGSKSASKAIMLAAGVPCVPGYHGDDQSVETLKREAKKVGFPVLIKAVKGGGGKGMKIVWKEENFEEELGSARREAQKSFGDTDVLIEKYLQRPRHVEVQIISSAPPHSQHLAISSRDCSVQRRHQKIIEEAPAPGLSDELRKDLEDKAVEAARAVGYVGAGTVEFIMDAETGEFFFMEMNTRLQVEHPVSEMISGIDLVEWQLLVASGGALPLTQAEVPCVGHSFEARLYAEDPASNFLPDVGHLEHLSFPPDLASPSATPAESRGLVRVDTGVRTGDDVSVFYDPMIAKLIVHGSDRADALRRMRRALEQTHIVGPRTNVDFLQRLCEHPAFVSADDLDTGFIARYKPDLLPSPPAPAASTFASAALFLALREQTTSASGAFASPAFAAFRLNTAQPVARSYSLRARAAAAQDGAEASEEKVVQVSVQPAGEAGVFHVRVLAEDKTTFFPAVSASLLESDLLTQGLVASESDEAVVPAPQRMDVFAEGRQVELELVAPEWLKELKGGAAATKGSVRSPMPSKVVEVRVSVGQHVEEGDVVVVLEAMKTEQVLRAPRAGVVAKIAASAGEMVGEGVELVTFEETAEEAPVDGAAQAQPSP